MSAYNETWQRLHELKAAREADLRAFLGEPSRADQWTGAGIREVRGMAASLASRPPDSLATQKDGELHRKCLDLARELSNG